MPLVRAAASEVTAEAAAPTRPVRPPAHPDAVWGVELVGWDGSVWWLSDPATLLLAGHDGLFVAPYQTRYQPYTTGAGSSYRGARAAAREVFLPVQLRAGDHDPAGFEDLRSRFLRILHPDRSGRLRVRRLDTGTSRSLQWRYDSGAEGASGDDAYGVTWCRLGLRLVCEQPFWEGDPLLIDFVDAAPAVFLDGDTWPFFGVTPVATLDSAVLTNPGDVDSWPVITVTGPATRVTIPQQGDTGLVDLDAPLTGGETVIIDTRPGVKTVVDGTGASRRADMVAFRPFPVPAGGTITLDLTVVGRGEGTAVRVELVPLFERPL